MKLSNENAEAGGMIARTGMRRGPSSIGILSGIDETGAPLVLIMGGGGKAIPAETLVPFEPADIGARVALLANDTDPGKPIVLGKLYDPKKKRRGALTIEVNGNEIVLTAKDRLVLKCGKASLMLTRAGRIFQKGTYLSSRSSGVSRIRGASLHIN